MTHKKIIMMAVLMVMFASSSSACAASLLTKFVKEGEVAKVVVYPDECGDDYYECVIADIGCDSPGGFFVSVIGFNGKEASSLLARSDGKVSNSIGTGPRIGFQSGPLPERGMTPLVSPAKPVGVAQPG